MNAYRKKPDIHETVPRNAHPASDNESMGCVPLACFVILSYIILSAILRATSNSGSKVDQAICWGTFTCLVITLFLGVRETHQESKAREKEREEWAKGCTKTSLMIVARHEASSWWDDYTFLYHNAPCSLDMEMNTDQKAAVPNQTIVHAEVSDHVYERLKGCSTVTIYYRQDSPLAFLIEEEL
jgi:hypothetical protein